jgi:hypothetical protein
LSAPDRTQAQVVARLKRLQMREMPEGPQPLEADCDLCGTSMPEDHRHLLHLDERRIVCVCESCWALRSGDAEYRPTGNRKLLLDEFTLPEDLWARFRIPIGLAFFLRSGNGVVALYPSPAGPVESELDLSAWEELVALNAELQTLEPEAEALVVHAAGKPPKYAIVPTDEAYRLAGLIKAAWEGISGGSGPEQAVERFFEELR